MLTLTQFLLRLSFGLCASMACVSPRLVTSGYFRNNLYVVLGLNVLATLVAYGHAEPPTLVVWAPLTAAVLSYVGAVAWLYEARRVGVVLLLVLAAVTLAGSWLDTPALQPVRWLPAEHLHFEAEPTARTATPAQCWFQAAVVPASGLVLGTTMAAMLLGHWYLNAPGMQLAPLRKLVLLMGLSLGVRWVLAAGGLVLAGDVLGTWGALEWALISLRWLAGLCGALALAWMAWQTLRIPNTQSATGLLYVAVMFVFLGELIAELLAAEALVAV